MPEPTRRATTGDNVRIINPGRIDSRQGGSGHVKATEDGVWLEVEMFTRGGGVEFFHVDEVVVDNDY